MSAIIKQAISCWTKSITTRVNEYVNTHGSYPGDCTTSCHRGDGYPILRSNLDTIDSDGDGFDNLSEIKAGTFPGDADDHLVIADTAPPTVTAFAMPSDTSNLTVAITILLATDNIGVTDGIIRGASGLGSAPSPAAPGNNDWGAGSGCFIDTTADGPQTAASESTDVGGVACLAILLALAGLAAVIPSTRKPSGKKGLHMKRCIQALPAAEAHE